MLSRIKFSSNVLKDKYCNRKDLSHTFCSLSRVYVCHSFVPHINRLSSYMLMNRRRQSQYVGAAEYFGLFSKNTIRAQVFYLYFLTPLNSPPVMSQKAGGRFERDRKCELKVAWVSVFAG